MKKYRLSILVALIISVSFLLPADLLARGGGGFSGGGSRSYSAPSRSHSYSAPSHSAPSHNTYSPPKTNYDSGAANALHSEQSQRNYLRANPKALDSGVRDPGYIAKERARSLSPNLSEERMGSRQARERVIYSDYSSRPIPQSYRSYNDGINIWFWMWLMDRPQYRDQYIYHHQQDMDPSRLSDLRAKDADLDSRLKSLETQGVKRDSSYVPPGVDADLTYSDDEVSRVYKAKTSSRFGYYLFGFIVLLLLSGFAIGYIRHGGKSEEKNSDDDFGAKSKPARKDARAMMPTVHESFYNPLNAEIGGFVSIPLQDLSGRQFSLVEIDDYARHIANKKFQFADYICQDGDTWITLRANPITGGDPYSTKKLNILGLYPHREFDYDEEFHKEILPTGTIEVKDDDGKVIATYMRLNNLKDPYTAEVYAFKDKSEPYEVGECDYWDFAREVDGKTEFYFVEMDKENGTFTTYRGVEVESVDILPAA